MIWLVGPDGELTCVSPPDFAFPGMRDYAETCMWCWSIAEAFALSRRRKAGTP